MYNQLTEHERYTLDAMNRAGFSARHIARVLDRSHTTIRRELSRNACHATDGACRPGKAQERTNGRRRRSRQIKHHLPEIYDWIGAVLQEEQWSPGANRRCIRQGRRRSDQPCHDLSPRAQGSTPGRPTARNRHPCLWLPATQPLGPKHYNNLHRLADIRG